MGKMKENVCPGCGRHCSTENVRCKYGRNYFEKQRASEQNGMERRKYKWERYVEKEGLLWKLLLLSAQMKKSLKSEVMTEEQLLSALTDSEQDALAAAIGKIGESMKNSGPDV